jgi:hypothetical protein
MVGNPLGKRRFGRLQRRWKDNNTMKLKQLGWENVDWIYVACC